MLKWDWVQWRLTAKKKKKRKEEEEDDDEDDKEGIGPLGRAGCKKVY